ncbi:MAG: hypothetical protein KKG96_05330 [Proteobacteria bacterium]|nr:hypothetical protein [Pseudomonadota bacterium]
MPELKKRVIGTSREQAPVTWVIHQIGSFLIGEFFNGGYYRDCLQMAKSMASQHRPALTAINTARKSNSVDIERIIAHLEDVSRWAGEVHSEGYHTVNTHVFISLWAAQEAGMENVISEILRTSNNAAKIASGKFQNGKYPLADWPWSESMCLDVAQKLDTKAKNATDDGGVNIARRTITLFSWFGLNIQIDDKTARKYNEASRVRNVILHRYGQLTRHDAEYFSELAQWVGEVLPITTERINGYYEAVIAMHLAVAKAVWSSEYK